MRNSWEITVADLRKELNQNNFDTWIKPIKFEKSSQDLIKLNVPNKFYKDWLNDNYKDLILNRLRRYSQIDNIDLEFTFKEEVPKERFVPFATKERVGLKNDVLTIRKNIPKSEASQELLDKYKFDTFVVGPSNQFACAASKAVAANPGMVYNPLFIYGGAGLGKTHLLIAIHSLLTNSGSKKRVLYKTSEKFTNEWINSIHKGKTDEFRAQYRDNCDILLLDDIQFLAGKEQTQVEFFHTFNTLYSARKQIVVTSDKYPKDIKFLDERLKSRLEWGLVCDIQPPETETRVAILKRKAELDKVYLPDDVALFLASNLKSNVRVLEGSLTKLEAFSSLTGQTVNLELAKDLFKSFAIDDKPITVERIQNTVSNFFNIKLSDIKSANRQKVFAFPRQIAMYLCRKLTNSSFPEIGMRFGGKDHSTIIHAAKKINKMISSDPSLMVTINSIEKTLLLRD